MISRSAWVVFWVGVAVGLLTPLAAIEPPFEMEDVTDGIYAVRRKFAGSNAAVIVNDRDVVVIDSPPVLAVTDEPGGDSYGMSIGPP